MRGVIAVPVLAVLTAVSLLAATTPQDSPPQAPPQLPPVFRGDVDLVRLDVSVLERDRRPITGLTADDFTVIEDGTPQTIGAFAEVLVPERDPKPTAWMQTGNFELRSSNCELRTANCELRTASSGYSPRSATLGSTRAARRAGK